MSIALEAFLFFLPAGISNMTPIFVSRLPVVKNWGAPLDAQKMYRGKRIFGKSKTWRGLIAGTVMAGVTGAIIYQFFPQQPSLSLAVAQSLSMGAGALLGDAAESFLKRQRNVPPGESWFPFDQTDYIIGGLLLALPFGLPSVEFIPMVFGLYFSLHLLCSYCGYLMGLKAKPI